MAPSSLAAALLQGTLLCSYFCSSVRQGFQITSKEVFFWFKSVFGQWYPCCEIPVCSQKWKSRAVWLEQFLKEGLFPLFSLPWTTWDAPSHSSVTWPEHLNLFGLFRSTCSNQTYWFVAVTFRSWENCRTLLLSSFCRCLSCHLPLLMPLQHRAHQAAALWGGAVSITILHLKN